MYCSYEFILVFTGSNKYVSLETLNLEYIKPNSTSCFMWVCNVVAYFKGREEIASIWEQNT